MNSRSQLFFPRLRAAAYAAALVCLGAPAAHAQFFNWWDASLPPEQIERMVQASGYRLTGPVVRRGAVYLADVLGRRNDAERLIISAHDGRLLQRFPSAQTRRRTADAGDWPNPPQQRQSNQFVNWFMGDDDDDGLRPPANIYGDTESQPLRVAPVAPARAPAVKDIARQDDGTPHVILAPSFQPDAPTNTPLLEKPRVRPQQTRRKRPEPTPVALPATAPGGEKTGPVAQPAAIPGALRPAASAVAVQSPPTVETKAAHATVAPATPAPKPAAKPALNDVPVAPLQ